MTEQPRRDLGDLTADYRVAFLRFLPRREEVVLAAAYELGRRAYMGGVSLLELARIHHEILIEVIEQTPPDGVADLAESASAFFLEVLATYEMAQD
ncbi:phosphatase RsbU N-terminal domain-containing protein [Monashia sp. NPDC004114]